MAEWSKACVSGTHLNWRGFESHQCHDTFARQDIPIGANAGKRWHERLSDCLRAEGFQPCRLSGTYGFDLVVISRATKWSGYMSTT